MTEDQGPKLSIFERFKTRRGELTTKARRQRNIIQILVESQSPEGRTRSAISKSISAAHGAKWQSAYPGVFKDMEETMVPLGLIREEGRLPMKRGPKAMQEQGSPFYSLTDEGQVVALSIREIGGREALLERLLKEAKVSGRDVLLVLVDCNPGFVYLMIQRYVEAWCEGRFELMPFDLTKLGETGDEPLAAQLDLLESLLALDRVERRRVVGFLREVVGKTEPADAVRQTLKSASGAASA